MSSGIKKRTGSEYSDGRPGRINYHSEDEYRTITLTLQATAEDMHDITHLRDAINELFDGEMTLREMRIKSVEVEYESMGQRTGELQLGAPEYVNGKQIKVTMVNSPEIDDTTLVSTFTVEFETTELPYFETIYTTLELHDSGYSATAEKYGLVDSINSDNTKYKFTDSNFSVWNAGNVAVEPEQMYLKITATGTNGKIDIRNKATGDTFKVNAAFGGDLVVDRMSTLLNGVNVFRDTNKQYISLASGKNDFEVIGQFTDITIDFRFYYK